MAQAGGRGDRFGQVGEEHRRQIGGAHRPAFEDRQADHHRLGNPVEHGSEHDRERGAALLAAVCILAFTTPEAVDQPVAAEEDPAAGEKARDRPIRDRMTFSTASSTRSNATALISTPAPKAKISPIARKLMRKRSAITAPITSEEAARVPQPKAAAI